MIKICIGMYMTLIKPTQTRWKTSSICSPLTRISKIFKSSHYVVFPVSSNKDFESCLSDSLLRLSCRHHVQIATVTDAYASFVLGKFSASVGRFLCRVKNRRFTISGWYHHLGVQIWLKNLIDIEWMQMWKLVDTGRDPKSYTDDKCTSWMYVLIELGRRTQC